MGNIEETKAHQFLLRVAEHLAGGPVGLEDAKIRAAQHDADRTFFEHFAEALLALSQRVFRALEALRQNCQLAGVFFGAASPEPKIDRRNQENSEKQGQDYDSIRGHRRETKIMLVAWNQTVARIEWRVFAELTGDADDLGLAPLHQPSAKLGVRQNSLREDDRDFP